MADPRTFTVKQCPPAYASKSAAGIASSTSMQRDFFNAVGKVGDLAVLNSVGGGTIGAGLRNLASISNSIRVGSGSLPTSIGSALDTGANWVLEQTGIAPQVVDVLRGFHPGIANQAQGQAQTVYNKVKSGTFKSSDIPGVLQDLQNLERLGRNIYTPSSGDPTNSLTDRCEASPYAIDLIARSPKFKFLFVVQFLTNDGYSSLSTSKIGPLDMAFVVKRSSRPSIKFATEDVNYYNYRSKVITKTEFEEMSMGFHDDVSNSATLFYQSYLRAMSPITGLSPDQAFNLEEQGMRFQQTAQDGLGTLNNGQILNTIPASVYSATSGTLANDNKQVFKEIRLYHLFDAGNKMNVYRFLNPRINMLELDDLDMSVGNEGSEITIKFDYDSVFLDADVAVSDTRYNIGQTQRGAVYPLRYNGTARTTSGSSIAGATVAGIPASGIVAGQVDKLNNLVSGGGIGGSIGQSVPFVADLSSKFSNALNSLSSIG